VKVVTLTFTGAGIRTWTPDKDILIQSAHSNVNWTIGTNPATVATDLTAPAAAANRFDLIGWGIATTSLAAQQPGHALEFPVAAGEAVFVSISAAGSVMIAYEEVAQLEG